MSLHIYSRSVDTGPVSHQETVWSCTEWSVSRRIRVRTIIHREGKESDCYGRLERWTDTGWHCLFGVSAAEVHSGDPDVLAEELINRFADWQECGHTHHTAGAIAEWDATH